MVLGSHSYGTRGPLSTIGRVKTSRPDPTAGKVSGPKVSVTPQEPNFEIGSDYFFSYLIVRRHARLTSSCLGASGAEYFATARLGLRPRFSAVETV